jgi:hypothetical protein
MPSGTKCLGRIFKKHDILFKDTLKNSNNLVKGRAIFYPKIGMMKANVARTLNTRVKNKPADILSCIKKLTRLGDDPERALLDELVEDAASAFALPLCRC